MANTFKKTKLKNVEKDYTKNLPQTDSLKPKEFKLEETNPFIRNSILDKSKTITADDKMQKQISNLNTRLENAGQKYDPRNTLQKLLGLDAGQGLITGALDLVSRPLYTVKAMADYSLNQQKSGYSNGWDALWSGGLRGGERNQTWTNIAGIDDANIDGFSSFFINFGMDMLGDPLNVIPPMALWKATKAVGKPMVGIADDLLKTVLSEEHYTALHTSVINTINKWGKRFNSWFGVSKQGKYKLASIKNQQIYNEPKILQALTDFEDIVKTHGEPIAHYLRTGEIKQEGMEWLLKQSKDTNANPKKVMDDFLEEMGVTDWENKWKHWAKDNFDTPNAWDLKENRVKFFMEDAKNKEFALNSIRRITGDWREVAVREGELTQDKLRSLISKHIDEITENAKQEYNHFTSKNNDKEVYSMMHKRFAEDLTDGLKTGEFAKRTVRNMINSLNSPYGLVVASDKLEEVADVAAQLYRQILGKDYTGEQIMSKMYVTEANPEVDALKRTYQKQVDDANAEITEINTQINKLFDEKYKDFNAVGEMPEEKRIELRSIQDRKKQLLREEINTNKLIQQMSNSNISDIKQYMSYEEYVNSTSFHRYQSDIDKITQAYKYYGNNSARSQIDTNIIGINSIYRAINDPKAESVFSKGLSELYEKGSLVTTSKGKKINKLFDTTNRKGARQQYKDWLIQKESSVKNFNQAPPHIKSALSLYEKLMFWGDLQKTRQGLDAAGLANLLKEEVTGAQFANFKAYIEEEARSKYKMIAKGDILNLIGNDKSDGSIEHFMKNFVSNHIGEEYSPKLAKEIFEFIDSQRAIYRDTDTYKSWQILQQWKSENIKNIKKMKKGEALNNILVPEVYSLKHMLDAPPFSFYEFITKFNPNELSTEGLKVAAQNFKDDINTYISELDPEGVKKVNLNREKMYEEYRKNHTIMTEVDTTVGFDPKKLKMNETWQYTELSENVATLERRQARLEEEIASAATIDKDSITKQLDDLKSKIKKYNNQMFDIRKNYKGDYPYEELGKFGDKIKEVEKEIEPLEKELRRFRDSSKSQEELNDVVEQYQKALQEKAKFEEIHGQKGKELIEKYIGDDSEFNLNFTTAQEQEAKANYQTVNYDLFKENKDAIVERAREAFKHLEEHPDAIVKYTNRDELIKLESKRNRLENERRSLENVWDVTTAPFFKHSQNDPEIVALRNRQAELKDHIKTLNKEHADTHYEHLKQTGEININRWNESEQDAPAFIFEKVNHIDEKHLDTLESFSEHGVLTPNAQEMILGGSGDGWAIKVNPKSDYARKIEDSDMLKSIHAQALDEILRQRAKQEEFRLFLGEEPSEELQKAYLEICSANGWDEIYQETNGDILSTMLGADGEENLDYNGVAYGNTLPLKDRGKLIRRVNKRTEEMYREEVYLPQTWMDSRSIKAPENYKTQAYLLKVEWANFARQLGADPEQFLNSVYLKNVVNPEEVNTYNYIQSITTHGSKNGLITENGELNKYKGFNNNVFNDRVGVYKSAIENHLHGMDFFNVNESINQIYMLKTVPEQLSFSKMVVTGFETKDIRLLSTDEIAQLDAKGIKNSPKIGKTFITAGEFQRKMLNYMPLVPMQEWDKTNFILRDLWKAKSDSIFEISIGLEDMLSRPAQTKLVGNTMANMVSKFLKGWKSSLLATPGYHIRNVISNFANAWTAGINPVEYTSELTKASTDLYQINNIVKRMSKLQAEHLTRYNFMGEENDFHLFMKEVACQNDEKLYGLWNDYQGLVKKGVVGQAKIKSDFFDQARDISKLAKKKNWGQEKLKEIINLNMNFGQVTDDAARLAAYRIAERNPELYKRLNLNDSSAFVRHAFFDFNAMTEWEKQVARKYIPFYTWMKKNLGFQMKMFMNNPGRLTRFQKVLKASYSAQDIDPTTMPEWVTDQMYLPIRVGDDKLKLIKWSLPINDFIDIGNLKLLSRFNPFLKMSLELMTGTDLYTEKNTNFWKSANTNLFEPFTRLMTSPFDIPVGQIPAGDGKTLGGLVGNDYDLVSKNSFWFTQSITKLRRSKMWEDINDLQNFIATLNSQGLFIPTMTQLAQSATANKWRIPDPIGTYNIKKVKVPRFK